MIIITIVIAMNKQETKSVDSKGTGNKPLGGQGPAALHMEEKAKKNKEEQYRSCLELTEKMKHIVNHPIEEAEYISQTGTNKFVSSFKKLLPKTFQHKKEYHPHCDEFKNFIDNLHSSQKTVEIKVRSNVVNYVFPEIDLDKKTIQYDLFYEDGSAGID